MSMTFDEGVELAAKMGHDLESDPPHMLSSVNRATCKRCGRAVLGRGFAYGSAIEVDCIEPITKSSPEPRRPVRGRRNAS